ncbi:ABC transporter ATP-binding protein [Paenibacillus senegalensis]|uniref:ABC transporter ATP-binding protein n=1 Tax=Paenibacillus senegalensis TaxID=1465766 RepID=UPI000289D14D|nr:ABC transporter ATP-binding protein [Paenibacillus senegalensis]
MSKYLSVENVFGGYFSHKPILKNISFSVNEGEMVGLIGLNGAGKSTTIKHILGLMKPQQGTIQIAGRTLEHAPLDYRASFAYVPETPELYDELTIQEHLHLSAFAYGLSEKDYLQRSEALLELFQMKDKAAHFPPHLSKGMRQKVMIMSAFLVEPALYIIDEPFLGLDPLGIRSLLELMVRFKKQGASFLICSHILSTLERYCDKFIVLHHGEILFQGTLSDMRQAAGSPEASLDDLFFELLRGQGVERS